MNGGMEDPGMSAGREKGCSQGERVKMPEKKRTLYVTVGHLVEKVGRTVKGTVEGLRRKKGSFAKKENK